MAGRLIIEVAQPALDSNGNLINGSTLEFYDAVTFTPKAVFSSAALTTSLGSVVTASGGFFPEMWANDGESYRVIWKNASGAVLRTIDNIQAPVAGESKSLRASSWGAVPTATAVQNRNALQAAIDYCSSLGGGTIEIDIPGYYSIAKRTSVPTDRALNVPKGVNIRGLGTGAPQDSGVALVTLQPSEDMTLFIAGDTISTQTCTISNASPCVITANNHGKVAGDVVYFATSGSLPAPLLPMFPYYVLAAGLTANSFRIGLGGSTPAINTTTAGSGVHTLISASSLTHSFGMSNINIYGGAVANVQCLIAESTVGAEWDNVLVEPGDATKQRHGWLHAANFLAAWLNQYTRLQVGGFTAGVGAAHYGSDSSYSQCLFSGSGVNFRFSEGSITIDGGQCENGNNGGGIGTGRGMELVPSNTGRNVAISIRSRFVANNGDIYIYDSPTGSGFNGRVLIDSTHHDCRATNISIGVNFNNVTIDGTFNEQNPAGVPHVTWRGASTGCVVQGNFSEGIATRFSNLPADALVLSGGNGQLNRMQRQRIFTTGAASNDIATSWVSRDANFTGGTFGFVNSALKVETAAAADVTSFEWGILSVMDNYATAGENVAIYGQAKKQSTGPTFAMVAEARDETNLANPTTGLVGLEVDLFANGTDNINRRVGIDIVIGRANGGGATCVGTAAIRVGPQNFDNANGSFISGLLLTGLIDAGINLQSSGTWGLRTTGSQSIGIDLSQGTHSTAAIRLAAGQLVSFEGTGARTLQYSSGSLQYKVSGANALVVTDSNQLQLGASQVLQSRITGWAAMTGTANRNTSYATGTITLVQLAERVKALTDDLITHGLIGA